MECLTVLVIIGILMGIIALLRRSYVRTPNVLHSHWWTAFFWMIIALVAFFPLLLENTRPLPAAWLIYVVSAWMAVSSWKALKTRRRSYAGEIRRRSHVPLRLFRETILGPISLLLFAWGTYSIGMRLADKAVERRDLVAIHLLSYYGFAPEWSQYAFSEAIDRVDLKGVSTCLAIDRYCYASPNAIIQQNSIALTALILRYHAITADDLLYSAVEQKNLEQAYFLVNHGANIYAKQWVSTDTDSKEITILQRAEQLHNQSMVAVLISPRKK